MWIQVHAIYPNFKHIGKSGVKPIGIDQRNDLMFILNDKYPNWSVKIRFTGCFTTGSNLHLTSLESLNYVTL